LIIHRHSQESLEALVKSSRIFEELKFTQGSVCPGEIYFENSLKYYLKSSLNKLRIALHSILRKDFIVYSKSQNHLGATYWNKKNSKFLNKFIGPHIKKLIIGLIEVDPLIFQKLLNLLP
jgi:hypothetical protein